MQLKLDPGTLVSAHLNPLKYAVKELFVFLFTNIVKRGSLCAFHTLG